MAGTVRDDVDDLVKLVNELVKTLEASRRVRREQGERLEAALVTADESAAALARQADQIRELKIALADLLAWVGECGGPYACPDRIEVARRLLLASG
jgi:ABC-type transporter Mla subunit MlaD